jgi:uncharacterized protein YjdB
MRDRSLLGALLVSVFLVPITSCINSPSLTSITVSPSTMNFGGAGLTGQLMAIGSYTHPGHAPTTKDITNSVTWTSSASQCVTVSNTGLITTGGNVCSNILVTASAPGFHGDITGSMTVNVTQPAGGGGGGSSDVVTSLTIIPTAQTVATVGDTAQFLAIGTTAAGSTEDLTSLVTWHSSSAQIATIGANTGLATAVGAGNVTISALYTNASSGTTVSGTATFTVTAGVSEQFTALTIIPSSQSISASGQTSQLIALATSGTTGYEQDVTDSAQITWTSSAPSIATVSATGLITGVSQGNATITAELTNSGGGSVVSATSTVAVSLTSPPEPILSLTIIPSSITVLNLQATGQFLAIGTYSVAPYVRDVTNSPDTTWISSAPSVFPVSTNTGGNLGATAGIVTAYGNGSATIVAETASTDGTIQTATATFNCPEAQANPAGDPPEPAQCLPGTQAPALLSTLTVYNEGLNTTNWEVTAPSATGTPNVLHCGPGWTLNGGTGGSVCSATYPINTTVTLTAPAGAGAFGGWSYNCVATGPVTAGGPNSCTILIDGTQPNITIGAIFN